MVKQSKRHFVVTVEGIPGTWRTFSGGGVESEVTRDYDGGALKPDLIAGIPEYEDITLVRTVDSLRDAGWLEPLKRAIGQTTRTIQRQPTDANLVAVGKPTVFPKCLLTGYTEVETDASSGDPAEVTLVFATSGPA